MPLSDLITFQPGKGIWAIIAIAFNLARFPLWLIYYIPRSTRPNPNWSLSQTVRIFAIRSFLYQASLLQVRVPCSLHPGHEGAQFVTVPVGDSKYFTGPLISDSEIKPAEIGGTWYAAPPKKGEKPSRVLLHFHGGAYVIGDGRKADCGFVAKNALAKTQVSHVFCPQYRLVTFKKSRFPAQLQDALCSYLYLINTFGIQPKDIIVSGDSAGAHLALGLLRYLSEHGEKVGLKSPGCAFIWSLWPSPYEAKFNSNKFSSNPNAPTDFVTPAFGGWGATGLEPKRSTGLTLADPYLDFINQHFHTPTPMFWSVGGSEMLIFDAVRAYEGFRKTKGNVTDIYVIPDAPHDCVLVGDKVDFIKPTEIAWNKAQEFESSHRLA